MEVIRKEDVGTIRITKEETMEKLEDKEVTLHKVKSVWPSDDKINIMFQYEEDGYTKDCSLTIWDNYEPQKIKDIFQELGFIGKSIDLAEASKSTDWDLLFPKMGEGGVEATLTPNEGKDGKIYWNVLQIGNLVVQESTNKIDKTKFVKKFGFIDENVPSEPSMD